jgi:hypothetical protein
MKKPVYAISVSLLLILFGCANIQKEIPFFKQTESGNCLQTNLKIALKYYYPDREYSFEQLDNATGRTEGKWTWTSQALEFLVGEGIDAYYYSTTPYSEILNGGEDFIVSYYGEQDAKIMIEHTDFDALYSSIRTLNSSGRYMDQKLDFSIIEQEFRKGNIVIMLIDRNVLENPGLSYAGHFVIITGINSTHVKFHDTSGMPNRAVNKAEFLEAWNAKGTDNDAIIIKGKL